MKNLKQKIDLFLWAFIWLLPFFAFWVSFYRSGATPSLLTYINDNFAFAYVQDLINEIWQKVFSCDIALAGYISYLIMVEVIHCMFDAIVFIPRFAHHLIEKGEQLCIRN